MPCGGRPRRAGRSRAPTFRQTTRPGARGAARPPGRVAAWPPPPDLTETSMVPLSVADAAKRRRNLLFLREPRLWPMWPFLPLVRRRPGREEEYGLLFDAVAAAGVYGFSATVFLANYFELPPTLSAFLALPREVFDAPD